jgi:UDP-glucose 4-epimerase
MITIGITGVAGFVGSNLASRLIGQNFKVIGVDDFSFGSRENIEALLKMSNFNFIYGDVRDYTLFSELKADIWVHLASQKIPRYSNSYRTLMDNDQMSENMIKKCLLDNVRLVFASTSDVYGKNPKCPFNENSDLVMGPTLVKRWAYATSKIYSEHKIIANSEEHNLKYTIMRFFGSYGPQQNTTWWGGPQSVFIQNILDGKKIQIHGDGLQTRTFTFIDDTVQGIEKCILNEVAVNQIYNIAGEADEETSISNLASVIIELMSVYGYKTDIEYIPYSNFGNYEDVMRRVPDTSKIRKELAFKPIWDLKSGLKKTIDWQINKFKN